MKRGSSAEIFSRPDEMWKMEKFIEEICDEYNVNNSYFGNILIAVSEAVQNAMVHGNQSDSEKTIKIRFNTVPDGLVFSVQDEGNGFNFRHIPDILDAAEGEYPGRGLFLIRRLGDSVRFNKKGNRIDILFKVSGINRQISKIRIDQLEKYFSKDRQVVQSKYRQT